ncbi:hypothetical protein V6Z11_A13G133600 [Gossypium hirsutum]
MYVFLLQFLPTSLQSPFACYTCLTLSTSVSFPFCQSVIPSDSPRLVESMTGKGT